VSPSTASLEAGTGSLAFKATVTNTTNTAVVWQVNNVPGGNASLGAISASGLYTPPARISATLGVTVTAVSVAVKARSGSAQVTVVAPASQGGGGALDALTLLAGLLSLAVRIAQLALRHTLRNIQPFLLRPAIVRGRDARLL
jgi:hypothetical protein